MSAQKISKVIDVPGRMMFKGGSDTIDLTTAYPHGGTAMGYISSIAFVPRVSYEPIIAEEFGDEHVEIVEIIGNGNLTFTLRQYDLDTIGIMFPDVTAAAADGSRTIRFPGGNRSGRRIVAAEGVELYFSPLDPRNPGALFYRAVPGLDQTTELRFNLNDELNIGCAFDCVRGSGGQSVAIDIFSKLAALVP